MPKISPSKREERRRQILKAAVSCFARRGFHQTTVEEICKAAGLSPGAVYRYFPSKGEIIRAVAEESKKRNLELLRSALSEGPVGEVALSLLRRYFQMFQEGSPEVAIVDMELLAEASRDQPLAASVAEMLGQLLQVAASLVEEAQRRGRLRADVEPLAVAQVLVACFQGLGIQKALGIQVDIDAYAHVVELLLSFLLVEA